MKKLFLLLVFSGLVSFAKAQVPNWVWAKSAFAWGDNYSYSVATDANNNIYITGEFSSSFIVFGTDTLINVNPDTLDFFLVKYDPSGNVIWAKSTGGSKEDGGRSVTTDADGNVYVTGYFCSPSIIFGNDTLINYEVNYNLNSSDLFLVKYDSTGNVLWAKSAGGIGYDRANSAKVDAWGNIYVTGEFVRTVSFDNFTLTNNDTIYNRDMFLVKFNPSGNVLWAKNAGGTSSCYGNCITVDAAGHAFVTGGFYGTPIIFGNDTLSNGGVFIVKYDVNGNVLWAKNSYGCSSYAGMGITIDVNNNIYATGYFCNPYISFDNDTLINACQNWPDFFLVKYNNAGNVVWAKRAGGTAEDRGFSVATDASANVYATGYFMSSSIIFGNDTLQSNTLRLFLVEYNTNGNVIWAIEPGGDDDSYGCGVAIDANNNLYLTGYFICYQPVGSDCPISFDNDTLTSYFGNNNSFLAKINNYTGIESIKKQEGIILFPNPTNSTITISNPKLNNATAEIISTEGKTIKSCVIKNNTIDVHDLPQGLYLLRIIGREKVVTERFVKE